MRTVGVGLWLAAVLLAPCLAQTEQPAAWVGTWLLDNSSMETAPNPQYKRVMLRLESFEGNGLKAVYDMVGTRGGVSHMEWTGRFDGKDYPVQGLDYVMTNAYTRLDDRSYSILVKVDAVPRATTTVSISQDGATMTATTTEHGPTNVPRTAVYRRKT